MTFNCLTIFPEMYTGFTDSSLCKKAIDKGIIDINLYNFRDYTLDKHKRVDDYPFGGGAGMLIMPQPVFDCFDDVISKCEGKKYVNIYMSPSGKTLTQSKLEELSHYDCINILCGHYEGIDQRIIDTYIDEEISIGDYVLTGGEFPSMIHMDGVMRYAGVLQNRASHDEESFYNGLLEYPQYTRPYEYKGMTAPDVLLCGDPKKIRAWQRKMSLKKTYEMRPDLLENCELSESDNILLDEIKKSY